MVRNINNEISQGKRVFKPEKPGNIPPDASGVSGRVVKVNWGRRR
jgi:hypothetical protein